MPQGRCAGCGFTDSDRKAKHHVAVCGDYFELFKNDPDKALDPVDELRRYRTEEMTSGARAVRRDQRLSARFDQLDALQQQQVSRWSKPKDILED